MESVCRGNSTVGSNPTLSAILRQGSGWQAILSDASDRGPFVYRDLDVAGVTSVRFDGVVMWYVYVLRSAKDGKLYVGSTSDLKRRISEHESGFCESTKHRTGRA